LKGSCRSDGTIAIPDLFAAARESFIECGGHNASGGFSVSHDSVHTLPEKLEAVMASLLENAAQGTAEESPQSGYDVTTTLREISWPLLRDVAQLSPFGIGNKKPVFRISQATVSSAKSFGKEKNHFEIVLESNENGSSMRAFDFFRSIEDFSHTPEAGNEVALLATLECDTFRSPARLALRIVDVLAL
jgi:single-stranded-DNA-specific exonuclease